MIRKHITKAKEGWRHWVDSDISLAALFFFLVFYGFVVYPLAGSDGQPNAFAAWSFSAVLILGVLSTTTHRGARLGMSILAVAAFASHWLHLFIKQHALHIVSSAAAAIFFAVLTSLIIARVFRSGGINMPRIYGALAAYLLIGVFWGQVYILTYLIRPSAFYFDPNTQIGEPPISELIYFSFVCLTTLGFGDIVPIHPWARSLATLEGLVGQIYPAVLLARLVTLYQK